MKKYILSILILIFVSSVAISTENLEINTNNIVKQEVIKKDTTKPFLQKIQATGLGILILSVLLIGVGIYALLGSLTTGLVLIGLGVGLLFMQFLTVQNAPTPNNNNNNITPDNNTNDGNNSKGKTNGGGDDDGSTSKGKGQG